MRGAMKLISGNVDLFAVLLIALLLGVGRTTAVREIRTTRSERQTSEHSLSDFEKRFKAARSKLVFISCERAPAPDR
jgi:hypothetical protein